MNGEHGSIHPSKMATGSYVAEAVVGIAALALAIIGLAHVFPWLLASVAAIALGAAFVFEAGAVGQRFSALGKEDEASKPETWGAWSGMTIGFLSGCAGVALGILALLGYVPTVLVPIAVIVYGCALLMDSRTKTSLTKMESEYSGLHGMSREVAREAASGLSGLEVLGGLGAITLGILALIRIAPQTLSLMALLAVGFAVLISSSLVGRFLNSRQN